MLRHGPAQDARARRRGRRCARRRRQQRRAGAGYRHEDPLAQSQDHTRLLRTHRPRLDEGARRLQGSHARHAPRGYGAHHAGRTPFADVERRTAEPLHADREDTFRRADQRIRPRQGRIPHDSGRQGAAARQRGTRRAARQGVRGRTAERRTGYAQKIGLQHAAAACGTPLTRAAEPLRFAGILCRRPIADRHEPRGTIAQGGRQSVERSAVARRLPRPHATALPRREASPVDRRILARPRVGQRHQPLRELFAPERVGTRPAGHLHRIGRRMEQRPARPVIFFSKVFWRLKNYSYLCIRNRITIDASLAQLVEHDTLNVGVQGSSP